MILKKHTDHQVRIDVNPDLRRKTYRAQLQKRKKATWRKVKSLRLTGKRHVRIIHVSGAGRYRVMLPAQYGYRQGASQVVRVK